MSQAFLQIKPLQRPLLTLAFIATCLMATYAVLVHVSTPSENAANQQQTTDSQVPSPMLQAGRPTRVTIDPARPGHRY